MLFMAIAIWLVVSWIIIHLIGFNRDCDDAALHTRASDPTAVSPPPSGH